MPTHYASYPPSFQDAARGEGAWSAPGPSDPPSGRGGPDREGLRRPSTPPPASRSAAENSRRLGRPSESGRLPLPEELGIVPEDQSALTELTDGGFEREVLASPLPYLVDFWAETCVPCRLQEPAIRRLARDLVGRIKVARLNVFDHPTTPDRLRIRGVPHLVVFVGGEVAMEMVGSHSYEQLRDKLRRLGIE